MDKILVKSEERKMLQDVVATEIKKENFVREILEKGLGEEILKEVTIKEPKKLTFFGKLKIMFSK